ncbi:amidohydrolase family protein [Yinghuangia sp. YIM S10712]|uniref:amidohydrolase family protein n=1 Tax=Yinghuangia sp. YIM S10712 TaxID=3436930 RepID=UPI003F536D48
MDLDRTPTAHRASLSRRRLLVTAAASAAGLSAAAGDAQAAPAGQAQAETEDRGGGDASGQRIDVHHHAVPSDLADWLVREQILPPERDTWPLWARWDPRTTEDVLEANGIAVGVASTPVPFDVFRSKGQARAGARACNESLAALAAEKPSRFGFFAYLPLPYVDLALAELTYAFDELGADGVLMMTHAGERYLGDPAFDPVFAELDRRKAVIFTHPLDIPGGAAPGVPGDIADFPLDTTRAAIRMIAADTLDRFPNVSVILSHAGGFIPYIAGRFANDEGIDPAKVLPALRRFHYDTALPASPHATPSLLTVADPRRIHFGTDWNANPPEVVADYRRAFDGDPSLDLRLRRRINRDNSLALFPRIAARLAGRLR